MKSSPYFARAARRLNLVAVGIACCLTPAAGGGPACDPIQSRHTLSRQSCWIRPSLPVGTIQYKLVVNNLDRAGAFYRDVLDLQEFKRFTSSMNLRPMEEILLGKPDGQLAPLVLIKFLDGSAPTHDQAVLTFFTADIDSFVARVAKNGGKVTERRDDLEHKARIAFWYDPDGNLAETVQMQ